MAILGEVRRTGRMETVGQRTRLEILDATETLLAMNGPSATSIRNIAARAEVNVAAVNYHFHSKDGLIDELLRRRANPLSEERLARLDACLASNPEGPPKLEAVLAAFVLPMLEFAASEHLAARALVSAQFLLGSGHRIASADKLQETVDRRFLAAFAAALPELDVETLHGRYRFLEGALTLAMCGTDENRGEASADTPEQKAAHQAGMEAAAQNFLAFAAAGLRSND